MFDNTKFQFLIYIFYIYYVCFLFAAIERNLTNDLINLFKIRSTLARFDKSQLKIISRLSRRIR